ncbi:MAG: sulfurtransferase TusA family protein [Desulfobacteraceae bacterium]|jgi:tRNA 2-thiouridine synthesizing protein A
MELENIAADKTLNAKGLSCPMPLLKTKKTLAGMAAGQVLEVISSDPGSQKDIPKLGNKDGNTYLGHIAADNGTFKYYIRKG